MPNFSYTITNIDDNKGHVTVSVTLGANTFTKRFQTQSADAPLGAPVSSKAEFEDWLREYVKAFKAGRALAWTNAAAGVTGMVNQAQTLAEG